MSRAGPTPVAKPTTRPAATREPGVLGVGVVGADISGRGFGPRAHLPAVLAVPGLRLEAVCTAHEESAAAAMQQWGAARAYTDFRALANDPAIDLITVAVRVRLHRPIVEAALRTGRMVYCEWPLGLDSGEAEALARQQQEAGIPVAVGLQGRFSPAVTVARSLLASGELGRPRTFHARQFLVPFDVQSDRAWLAQETEASGALVVATAHVADLMAYLIGDVEAVCAWKGTIAPTGRYSDTGDEFTWQTSDTVAFLARLAGDVLGSCHVTNAAHVAEGFTLTVVCEQGQLALCAPGYVSFSPCRLFVTRAPGREYIEVPAPPPDWIAAAPETVRNVAIALHSFAASATSGTAFHPDFDDALRLHGVVESITRSFETGGWIEVGRRRIIAGSRAEAGNHDPGVEIAEPKLGDLNREESG